MRRRVFSRLHSRSFRECLTVHIPLQKSVRDQDLKYSVLFSSLHPEIWKFLTEIRVSNSQHKSSKHAKTQENVKTRLPETSYKNKTYREQQERKISINMRWKSNILLAVTKYDKYCASVLTESGWFISLI